MSAILTELGGWEVIKSEAGFSCPCRSRYSPVSSYKFVAPFLSVFCLANILIARKPEKMVGEPSVSIVIPARNEAGNILAATRGSLSWRPTWSIFYRGTFEGRHLGGNRKSPCRTSRQKDQDSQADGTRKGDAVRLVFRWRRRHPDDSRCRSYHAAGGSAEILPLACGRRLRICQRLPCSSTRWRKERCSSSISAPTSSRILFSWLLGQNVKGHPLRHQVLSRKNYEAIARNRTYFGTLIHSGILTFSSGRTN